MQDLPGDAELKKHIGKKLVAIRSLSKPTMNMMLNDLVGELQTKQMARGGGFYEGWGFNDTFKVLLKGKPSDRNDMYRELEHTFPDSERDKLKADGIEIFVNDNQLPRLRKLARMFKMKVAYMDGGKMANGGSLNDKQEEKFGKVMHEWKEGELHSGSKKGPIVKDQDQAVAIAFSEARKMAGGGNIEWQKARIGDSARVVDENKMGVILKDYGRKFHLKFVDGTEKTYDASELDFYRLDEDEYGNGGNVNIWHKGDITIVNGDYRNKAEVVPTFKDDRMLGKYFVVFRDENNKIVFTKDNFEMYTSALEYAKENVNNSYKFKDGGDVRDYEWYQGFKKLSNAPKPAHYTAIADLGTRKIKRHLDNRMEVDEFLNEMSDREAISVELSKFTEQGLTRTVKFDWTGGEWELVSDETVEKKKFNLKKED
jgi:hypothetical protein